MPHAFCLRLRSLLALLGAGFLALAASAQQGWQWANSLPASVDWKDVAFGNGLHVAVGGDGTIATSPDGAAWTLRRTSTAQVVLNGVEFGGGRFVAVGMGTPSLTGAALIMTSTDGIAWSTNETVASSINAQLVDVAYGAGTWVVTGFGGTRILSSTDGASWTQRAVPGSNTVGKVAFGGGRFVAVANNHTVYTSADGIAWTNVAAAPANAMLSAVAYGAGKFAVVGRDNNFNGAAYTSADGTTWSPANAIAGAGGGVGFIAVGGHAGGFVAAGGTLVYSSADGVSWTARTSALPSAPRQLATTSEGVSGAAFAGNQFFVTGSYGSITTSPDGVAWIRRSTGTVAELGAVLHDGNRFVVSGSGGTILTSPDGSAWTQVTTGSTGDFNKLAFGAGRYVAVGFTGVHHSASLTAWTTVAGTSFDRWTAVAHGGGRFVAANSATTLGTRSSVDGVTWNPAVQIPGAGGNTNGLVYGNGLFVLTMAGFGNTPSKIYTSPDGTAWTQRGAATLPASQGLFSLAFGNGRFVILTGSQTALTSTDGIAWTLHTLPSIPQFTRVRFLGDRFFASASTYGSPSYASADGVVWSPVPDSLAPNSFYNMGANSGYPAFALAGSTVVAVGPAGAILRGSLPVASAAGRLVNMSIRTNAGTGDNTLIVGVGIGGANTSGSKAVLLRGVGPTLAAFGVAGTLPDPLMTVFSGPAQIAQNDDWTGGFDFASVGAFALAGNPVRDAAIFNPALPAGSYSIQITGKGNATGIALAEIYDATPTAGFAVATPRLVNVSARTEVGTGDNILIAGFSIGGASPLRVLIRAVGPTLATFGVGGTLADPRLQIFRDTTQVAENDNWNASDAATFESVGAFRLAAGSRDAALVITLQPGTYTAQVSGANAGTGVALVEVYELP